MENDMGNLQKLDDMEKELMTNDSLSALTECRYFAKRAFYEIIKNSSLKLISNYISTFFILTL